LSLNLFEGKKQDKMSTEKGSRISLKNNLIISFFIVSVLGVIITSILLHKSFITHLYSFGIDKIIINSIDGELTKYCASAAGSAIAVVLAVWIYLFRKIVNPLQQLTDGMSLILEGNLGTRIFVSSNDEIGKLADGFNSMAGKLEVSLKKLEESKHQTENIMRSVPSILIVVSNRFTIISTNMEFNSIQEQYPTLDINEFIRQLEVEIKTTMETGKTIRKEIEVVPEQSNNTLIFLSTVSRLGHENNSHKDASASVLLTITDMTYRHKMKELVFQSQQDWEDTFNTLPDMITIHDRDYNIIQANKAATDNLKLPFLSPDGINKCYKYYHGTESAPEGCPSCKCYDTAEPATFELFEGNLKKYIEIRSIPRLNKESEVIGLIHIVRDITQRKKIEQEHEDLLKSVTSAKLEWEATFDTVSELIILVDKDLNIIRCNQSFADYVGLSASEIIQRLLFDCFRLIDPTEIDHNQMLIQNEKPLTREEVQSSDKHWFYVSHRPINDKDGVYMFTVVIATDITDLKSTQNSLLKSEKELKMKVNDLEKFYEMAVGREVKMKKLKREINSLRSDLSQTEGNGSAAE
jgi:PAS domain S-box-containing protein